MVEPCTLRFFKVRYGFAGSIPDHLSLSRSLSFIPYKRRNKSLRLLRNAGTPVVSSLSLFFTICVFSALVPYPTRLITHLFIVRIDRDFLSLVEALFASQKSRSRHQQRRGNPCKCVVDNLNDAKKSLFPRQLPRPAREWEREKKN